MIWATTEASSTGKAHCWYGAKNSSSADIWISYCGRITRTDHLQQGDGIGHCLTCTKRRDAAPETPK